VILLKQPIGIAAANRHIQLSTSCNFRVFAVSVDQFSNLGRFSGQNFDFALLLGYASRFTQVCTDQWGSSQDAARPHSAAHFGESSIATAKRYVWQPMHAMHADIIPQSYSLCTRANFDCRGGNTACCESSGELVSRFGGSGELRSSQGVSLKLRIFTVRPPIVAR